MSLLGAGLVAFNAYSVRRDFALATGAESPAQKAFLVDAADRPDIATFFKRLTPEGRLSMAKAIGRYQHPKLPKLTAVLLADFDAAARRELSRSLDRLAPKYVTETANELSRKGSFQTLAVTSALRKVGAPALPAVAAMLANGDARPAAISFLVASGPPAIPYFRKALADKNVDVKSAAADGLGKLRAREAVPELLAAYRTVKPENRPPFLSAVAAIGDPAQESLLVGIAQDPSRSGNERAQAVLGLGRIGSPRALAVLARLADEDDLRLRDDVAVTLATLGPRALALPLSPDARLRVAAGIDDPAADRVIMSAPGTDGVSVAKGRPRLVPFLTGKLAAALKRNDGALASMAVSALRTTPDGESALAKMADRPDVAALLARAV